jgi:hypothetical protein
MSGRRRWRVAWTLAPLLIAVPALVSLGVTLLRALGTAHPDLGFSTAVNSDAEAFYLGQAIDRDPADGYSGQVPTPLFPFLVSLAHHVSLWGGWPLVFNMTATLSIVGLTACLAYDDAAESTAERSLALVGAVGLGAMAWWFVSAVPVSVLYEGRHDHTAWAFALFGLVLLARGAAGRRWMLVGALLLLSAAFWTKQTTAVAGAAGALWILAAAALGAVRFPRALAFCSGLVVLNVAVLGLLNLLTDGWEYYFDFELPREQPKFASFGHSLREFFELTGAAWVLAAVLAAGLLFEARAGRFRRGNHSGRRTRSAAAREVLCGSADARLSSLLLLFAVIGVPAVVYFRLKVGGEVNQYVGVVWALGVLAAIAYRRSGAHAATGLLAVAAVLALFLTAQLPGHSIARVWVAPLSRTASYPELPPQLLEYARTHLVYDGVHSDLNVEPQRSIYPNFYNFVDLLAGGKQPMYLVNALLDRRFDAVAPFRFSAGGTSIYWELYASAAGRHEANYFWKLNRVIRAGYRPAAGVPAGFLARRPGRNSAAWMRSCFGPFELAGTDFSIRAGGGFWCREGDVLRLRETPAARSEVHALDDVSHVAGTLGVALRGPPGSSFDIALGGVWRLQGRTAGRTLALALTAGGRPVGELSVPARARGVRLAFVQGTPGLSRSGGDVTVALPEGSGDLSIQADRGSGARFDFARAELSG